MALHSQLTRRTLSLPRKPPLLPNTIQQLKQYLTKKPTINLITKVELGWWWEAQNEEAALSAPSVANVCPNSQTVDQLQRKTCIAHEQ